LTNAASGNKCIEHVNGIIELVICHIHFTNPKRISVGTFSLPISGSKYLSDLSTLKPA
jgi:hypothetical protein